jgi:exopolysaccharide biosynthesis polyprenyl glycosylphosphotransferase
MDSIAEKTAETPGMAPVAVWLRPRRLLLVADVVSAGIAILVMYEVLYLRGILSVHSAATFLVTGLVFMVTVGLSMRAGQYTNRRRMSLMSDVGVFLRDMVIAGASAILLSYITQSFFTGATPPSRLAVGAFVLTFLVLGTASRFFLGSYQRRLFAQGRTVRGILVLGSGAAATDFLEFVNNRPWLGVVVAGRVTCCDGDLSSGGGSVSEIPSGDSPSYDGLPTIRLANSLEGLEELDLFMRSCGATDVVVALGPEEQAELPCVARLLSLAHVPFKVVPSLFEQSYRATELLGYAELPVINVEVDPLDRVARFFKRTMDVCVAMFAIIVLLPLELAVVAAIVADSGLPIFYKQERVGQNGRRFQMFKFRTMVKDADRQLPALLAMNEAGAGGRMFKIREDPRATRVGKVLRRFSLDELPQVINVLRREMSMVGPRPPLPAEVQKYEQVHLYRLKARPGITGLWQISGRSDLDFEDMVKLDRHYLDNWSIRLDVGILLKTFFVVMRRKGAY